MSRTGLPLTSHNKSNIYGHFSKTGHEILPEYFEIVQSVKWKTELQIAERISMHTMVAFVPLNILNSIYCYQIYFFPSEPGTSFQIFLGGEGRGQVFKFSLSPQKWSDTDSIKFYSIFDALWFWKPIFSKIIFFNTF